LERGKRIERGRSPLSLRTPLLRGIIFYRKGIEMMKA
jgi:hypothetical protein